MTKRRGENKIDVPARVTRSRTYFKRSTKSQCESYRAPTTDRTTIGKEKKLVA